MTNPSLQPVNIHRLLKENTKISDACGYAKSICQGSIVAGWHETGPSAKSAKTAAAKAEREEDIMQKQQLRNQRKLRLKQLLEQERLALEAELHQRGLALTKVRD